MLARYARGEFTLDQVLGLLDEQVHHVQYRSQATVPFRDEQLTDLLEESKAYNEAHQITGVLCYGDNFFIQVLEGSQAAVHALYAKIRRDGLHQHVLTLRDATAPGGKERVSR